MPVFTAGHTAQSLRETNSRLSIWLDVLTAASEPAQAATPCLMADLLSELMSIGQRLQEMPRDRDAALERELSEYRKHVERLRKLLPVVHGALLQERARLEKERSRVEAAAEWARRSRQTL